MTESFCKGTLPVSFDHVTGEILFRVNFDLAAWLILNFLCLLPVGSKGK